jgi:hypothetical protein
MSIMDWKDSHSSLKVFEKMKGYCWIIFIEMKTCSNVYIQDDQQLMVLVKCVMSLNCFLKFSHDSIL